MKVLTTLVLLALSLGIAHGSDFVGAYALISKVTLEPGADNPQRIQISGVFALADPKDRNSYLPPQRGYLYFTLPPLQSADQARKEWSDLKNIAGTGKVVALGARGQMLRIRDSNEKPASPD